MFKYFIVFFLLIQVSAFDVAAVKITGKAEGFENAYIRLYLVSDYISGSEEKMDVAMIDAKGNFELNGYMRQAGMIKIKIEDKSFDLISRADFHLKVLVTYHAEENADRIYDKELNVEVLENSDLGINALIFSYQKDYADFLEKNHSKLVTKNILPQVFVFQDEMRAKYKGGPKYFQTYLTYDLATLEDAVLGSEQKLFNYYISGKAVSFDNVAYMNFFRQFYHERFIQLSQGKNGFQLLSAVNGTQDYDKLLEIVAEHAFSENDTIRELFIIQGLQEVYGDETFKKAKVLSMLEVVRDRAINPENKRIAANVLNELNFLARGSIAPDYNLFDKQGTLHHLKEHQGKAVLLIFWSASSTICLRDFSLVKEYQLKYGEKIDFVAVNMEDDLSRTLVYLERNEWPFLFLFKDNQYDLVDKYRFRTWPFYVLIDKHGLIYKYPAGRPQDRLEREIFDLLSEN